MLTLEIEPASFLTCDCCNGVTTALTRFVYRDGDAHAIYYARFSAAHPERPVKMLVSLGEWGEGSDPSQRRSFALDVRTVPDSYQVMVTDAAASPWSVGAIGRVLDRQEALQHPWVKEAFRIVDHAVEEDAPLREHLERSPVAPTA